MAPEPVKDQGENKKPKTGFHTNPERINRKGRPPNDTSFTAYAKYLFMEHPEHRDKIIEYTVEQAKRGDKDARKILWEYMDGKPRSSPDDPGSETNPLRMEVVIRRL